MRKTMCVFLLLAMLLTMAVPAFADETQPAGGQVISETPPETTAPPAPSTEPSTPPETTAPPATTAPSAPAQCSHVWDAGTGTDATCTAGGSKTYTCTLCQQTKTETTQAKGHTYGEWSATVDAHSRTCSVCQNVESGSHSISESVTQQPTCKEEGVYAEYCATCDFIVYEVLPKLETHTYDNSCDTDCNVCGLVREVKHDLQAWWSKGASGHWHACKKCGYQGDFGKHYPGPAATEEKAQICLTCEYTLTPKLNHVHEYAQNWTADEEGHWYACSGCEEQKDFIVHDYDDPCDSDCNICGYQNGNAHTFDGTWHSDEDGHWFVCMTCGGVVEPRDHVTGEAAAGENTYCADCGYLMAVAEDHTHAYGEIWLKDDDSHWQECQCGETSEKAAHVWDEERTQEDQIIHTCSQCGAEYAEEIPEEEAKEFPWGIVFVVLLVMLAGSIVALILVLKPKKGKFSD